MVCDFSEEFCEKGLVFGASAEELFSNVVVSFSKFFLKFVEIVKSIVFEVTQFSPAVVVESIFKVYEY